jgi:RHS repeat-associated protein
MKKLSCPLAVALLLCLFSPRYSQATPPAGIGNDNATGKTGEYSGSVTTGGSYDPYTGNAKRFVDDLTVTASVGVYPLKWTRILNTRGYSGPFGNGGGWNHSYSWGLSIRPIPGPTPNCNAPPEPPAGTVSYPDGREVMFDREVDSVGVETWTQVWGGEPIGDRLVHIPGGTDYDLRLQDGGRVEFRTVIPGLPRAAQRIVDPYNQVTTLHYVSSGGPQPSPRLDRITEPAGRYLQIEYWTYPRVDREGEYYPEVTVIKQVTVFNGPHQVEKVVYVYDEVLDAGYLRVRFYNLERAIYDEGLPAVYTYFDPAQVNPGNPWTLAAGNVKVCNDVRYAGAMSKIEYEYAPAGPASCGGTARGQIKAERNLTTNVLVSSISYPSPPCVFGDTQFLLRTETRGDGATRIFKYTEGGELDRYTDFAYSPQDHQWTIVSRGDAETSDHYLKIATPVGLPTHRTTTEKDYIIGALMAVIHPNGSRMTYTYTDPNNPYYLASQEDENGHITYFDRYGAPGFPSDPLNPNRIWRIRYPDGGWEMFTYNLFGQVLWHRMPSGGEERFAYDARGLKETYTPPATTSDQTPWNNPTHYFYYPDGWNKDRLQYVKDPRLNSTLFEYNLRGQVTKLTHQDGTFTQTFYKPDGTVERSIDELGHITRFEHDEYKRVTKTIKVVDNIDEVTENDYKPLTGGLNEFSHTTSSVYRILSPLGKVTQFGYDANFRRKWTTVAFGTDDAATTNYISYDPVGNLTRVEDPRHKFTTFGYDDQNRQTLIWNEELNESTGVVFDDAGNKKGEAREGGAFRSWDYDEMNRLWKAYDWRLNVTPQPYQTTTYDRDEAGNVLFITDTKGAVYSFLYDKWNRKENATYPPDVASGQSQSETWLYDKAGNLILHKNPAGRYHHFEYDERNRQRRSYWNLLQGANTNANRSIGQEIIITPDAASRITEIMTNGGETIVGFGYDHADRKIWEDQTLAGQPTRRVKTELDHEGKRLNLKIVDPELEATTAVFSPEMSGTGQYSVGYTYTERNQVKMISGEDWQFHYGYDPSGNLSSRRADYNGRTNWTKCPDDGYDALNRPTRWEQTGPNGFHSLSHYRYDKVNREEATWRAEDNNRGESFEYEITNQLKKVSYNVTITPTPAPPSPTPPSGSPTPPNASPTPPNGSPTPPPAGQVEPIVITVDGEAGQEIMHVTMHTDTAGATIFYRMSPDNFFNPVHNGSTGIHPTATYSGQLSVPVHQLQYFRAVAYKDGMNDSDMSDVIVDNNDGGGNGINTAISPRVVTYGHPPNRLNRTSMNDNGTVTNYSPNLLNQYTSTPENSFSYDHNFNMTHTAGFYGIYDAANRLVSASGEGGQTQSTQPLAQFVYDGLGRCVKRTLSGVGATVFVYDGWKPIGEFDNWGYFQAWNVYGPGPDEILLRQKDKIGYTRFLLDRHGNVAFLVDNDGVVREKYTYDVFGHPRVTDGNGANARLWSNYEHCFMFQGHEYISELGLYDFRNRFYHPQLGRFIQSDPIGLQTEGDKLSAQQAALYVGGGAPETFSSSELNLYRYCNNDPVNGSDPDGLVDLSYTPSTAAFAAAQHWEASYNPTNTFTVAGHADLGGIKTASGGYVSMQRIVNDIVRNNTENKPIELIACQTGRGVNPFARQLAKAVAAASGKTTRVIAPTTEVTGGRPGEAPRIRPEIRPGGEHLALDNKARYDWSKPGKQREFTVTPNKKDRGN